MSDPRTLLARVVTGDQDAWRELVARYQRLVFAIIRRHRIPQGDDEDLFQETFLRLHRNAHRIRENAALTGWIAVTARNLCLDYISRVGRRPTVPLGTLDIAADVDVEHELERQQAAEEVRAAVAELSERCRQLLWALYFEQDSPDYRSVSERLGMPIGSIGPTRARCLERLLHDLERRRAIVRESS